MNFKAQIETETDSRHVGDARVQNVPKRRALIVNDEPATAVLIREVLGSAGIDTVTLAAQPNENSRFQKEKYDVVFVDVSTPIGEGHELVRNIRSAGFNRNTPIIMISQDQRPGALAQGFAAGASFFVYKPIDRARLTRLIRVAQGTIEHEKRRFRRVPVHAKVRIKTSETEVVGETVDISMNGILAEVARIIPIGSVVEVTLYLPTGTGPIVGLGRIVRILSGTQMGILLDGLPAAEAGRLQEYLLPKVEELEL